MLETRFHDITHPDDRPWSESVRSRLLDDAMGLQTSEWEKRYLHKNGQPVWVSISASLVRDPEGTPQYFVTVSQDISKRKRAEQLLALEHALMLRLAEASDESEALVTVIRSFCETEGWDGGQYWRVDEPAGVLRSAESWCIPNTAFERLCEASRRKALLPGQGLPGIAWQSGEALWIPDLNSDPRVPADSSARKAGVHAGLLFPVMSQGKTLGVLAFSSWDIREPEPRLLEAARVIGSQIGQLLQRKNAEAGRTASERFAKSTLDALTKHICVIDEAGTIITVNQAWRDFAAANDARPDSVSEGANYLQACRDVAGPDADEAGAFAERVREVMDGRCTTFSMEYACHSPTEQRWFLVRVTRFADSAGPVRIVVAHENITERVRREEELRRFRASMDATADAIFLVDRTRMRHIDVNEASCRLTGYTREELLALPPETLACKPRADLERGYDAAIAAGADAASIEAEFQKKDGSRIPVEVQRRALRSGDGWIMVGVARDIGARKQAEQAVRRHAKQQGLIAAFGQLALARPDLDELLNQVAIYIADGLDVDFCEVLQHTPDGSSLLLKAGTGWEEGWIGRSAPDAADTPYRKVLDSGEPILLHDLRSDRRFRSSGMLAAHGIASGVVVPIAGSGKISGVLGAFSRDAHRFSLEDVDFLQSLANTLETAVERRHAEERLAHMAQFDALTGLPNRNLFHDRLTQILTQADRNAWRVGVLFVDLDRFKIVNDTLGHSVGDKLLHQTALRLQDCVRSGDTVARLGGDEFGIVLPNLARADDAGLVAQKVAAALAKAFDLEGRETYVSASLGIALYPGDGEDPDGLLKNAETAMYRSKEQGRNRYQFYLPQMNERAIERLQLETQLRGALERGEFLLHYQPKADLYSGEISGFEALLRWQHPERGLVPPNRFIPILEDNGLIIPVGDWVLRSVCEQVARWQAEGLTPRPVAVNLSARQFQQKDLDARIGEILSETGVDPGMLELELTESLLMEDAEGATRTLQNLKARGLRLAVDDFGTGYSSLAYLKRFPIDSLKIDRAFIRDCITDPDDAAIALAVINLAHSLKLKVVAEGVETEAQLNFLRNHGCDQIQGYYFARPLELGAATRALTEKTRLAITVTSEASQAAVLLVDDNAFDLELIQDALAPDGYRLLTAKDPKAALDVLANHTVAVVISDHRMPSMSGVQFLAAVRALYPRVIRVMHTGSDQPGTLSQAVNEAGIHKYLSKHWDAKRLRAEVREAYRLSLGS